jgi:large subunit ribosomal protein L17
MKKRKRNIRLSRSQGARKALFRAQVRAFIEHGSIITTRAKGKALSSLIDKYVNLAKKGGVEDKRRLYGILGNDRVTSGRLFEIAKNNFSDRSGGYVRIVNLQKRRGDSARMVKVGWVEKIVTGGREKSKGSKRSRGKVGSGAKLASSKKKSK